MGRCRARQSHTGRDSLAFTRATSELHKVGLVYYHRISRILRHMVIVCILCSLRAVDAACRVQYDHGASMLHR